MSRRLQAFCAVAFAAMLIGFTSAGAQQRTGGFDLEAELQENGINLSWENPEDFSTVYFLVYRAQVSMNSMTLDSSFNFIQIDSTTVHEYQDTTALPPSTVFVYMVQAYDSTGQVRTSSIARVYANIRNYAKDKVTITSQPPLTATVDSLYQYQVQAVSTDSTATLTYRLDDHPDQMAIDSTGMINWVPQRQGWYEVGVLVTSSGGGRAVQQFAIRVGGLHGTISGTVTDSSGIPVPGVLIRLYQRDTDLHFDYRTTTDSTGHYTISNVDAGKYLVRAVPLDPNYLPEWYDNVSSMANATPIDVSDTAAQVANFALQSRSQIAPKFTVSGTVTDTTGAVLKGAMVVFARAEFSFNNARDNQQQWEQGDNYRDVFQNMYQERNQGNDFSLDGNSPYVFRTYTDSNGVYSDTLPQGVYVAFAKATGYHRIFYNDESDFLSADAITLDSNLTGINFALTAFPPVALGQISGSVLDSTTGADVSARIIAFRDVWDHRDTLKMHVAGAYFADADSTGAYTLNNLPPGYYKILAIPLGSYAPSFYGMNGPTVRWSQATAVPVDGNSTSGIDIYVMPLPSSASGYTAITGNVSSTSATGSNKMSTVSSTLGISGALVYATDTSGDVAGYGVTDANGNYTIPGIAPGTYSVFTEATGYTSSTTNTASPSYSSAGSPVTSTASFTVSPQTVTAVRQTTVQPTNYTLDQNYPNPFNPTTQIAFSIPQEEHVTVAIFNILGERIATLVDGSLSAGSHIVTWNARNEHGEMVSSGVYFYRLSTQNFTAVKKMLLLK